MRLHAFDARVSFCYSLSTGLSIRFEVDDDILKVDGHGGRRPPQKQGVWEQLTPPAGYRGRAQLGVQMARPPEAK